MIILFAFCCLQSLIIPHDRVRQVADVFAFDIMVLLMFTQRFLISMGFLNMKLKTLDIIPPSSLCGVKLLTLKSTFYLELNHTNLDGEMATLRPG